MCDRSLLSVAILGLCSGGAQHAESQTRTSQIGPAVFGGTGTRADKPGGLDLSAELFGSYYDRRAGGSEKERSRPPEVGSGRWTCTPGCRSAFNTPHRPEHELHGAHQQLAQLLSRPGRPDDHLPSGRRHCGPPIRQALHDIREPVRFLFAELFDAALSLAPLPVDPGGAGSLDGPPLAAPDVDSTILQRASLRYGGNAELRMVVARHSTLTVGYRYTKTDLSTSWETIA